MEKDLIIRKRIGLKKLYIHKSHKLPTYLKEYPFYDRALPRICEAIKQIDNKLVVIDIGANIGDTISLITDRVTGKFLCIEGDKKYLPLLKRNVQLQKIDNVTIEPTYCGDGKKSKEKLKIKNENGTARIEVTKSKKATNVNTQSLDKVLDRNPHFKECNILKIDTDGFEGNILNGAKFLLEKSKPVLFFEFTPKLYYNLKQDPFKILQLLVSLNYKTALFYDNYGRPKEIVDLNNTDKIRELIGKIDEHNIYYYDILAINEDKPKYNSLFVDELLKFADLASSLVETQKVDINNFKTINNKTTSENIILKTTNEDLQKKLTALQAQLTKSKSWINELYNTKSWKIITFARTLRTKLIKPIKVLEKK